jgi:hypothetical protein
LRRAGVSVPALARQHAHVAIAKFCDHLPLHRQSVIYAREGVELDRATMADWIGKAVFLLTPLAEAIGRHVRAGAGATLHADDTTVPVLSPWLGKTATGRLWVLVRDERPWGSAVPPAVLYRYSPERRGIHAEALLASYGGFLHADGYAGFDRLYRPTTPAGEPRLIEVDCWSHVRRKFYDDARPVGTERARTFLGLRHEPGTDHPPWKVRAPGLSADTERGEFASPHATRIGVRRGGWRCSGFVARLMVRSVISTSPVRPLLTTIFSSAASQCR